MARRTREPATTRARAVQLRLLPGRDAHREWVLDERTRTLGRQGVAEAREILRRSQPPEPQQKAS